MAIPILNAESLQQKLKAIKEKATLKSGNYLFKLTKPKNEGEDDSAVIRLLPYPHNEDWSPFFEVWTHYGLGGTIPCLKNNFGEHCPICEQVNKLYAAAKEIAQEEGIDAKNPDEMRKNARIASLWDTAKTIRAQKKTMTPIVIRGKESDGFKFYGMSDTFFQNLFTSITKKVGKNPKKNPLDPFNGVDIEITMTNDGKKWGTSSFDIMTDEDTTPALPNASVEEIEEFIKKVPNVIGSLYTKKSEEEINTIVNNMVDEDGLIDLSKGKTASESSLKVEKKVVAQTQDSTVAADTADKVSNAIDDIDDFDDDDV